MPVWACYDCLVMISHLPLVNVSMSGSATIFLSTVAKILRFDFIPLNELMENNLDVGSASSSFNDKFSLNGYGSTSILLNLAVFVAFFVIMILANATALCLDCGHGTSKSKAVPNGRTHVPIMSSSQKALNAFFRLILFTFFEFFVCILINFKAVSSPFLLDSNAWFCRH